MNAKIFKITLYVNDQEHAKRFWVEQVGFAVKLEQPMGPDMKWLEVGPEGGGMTTFVLYEKKLMEEQNPEVNVGHPSVIFSTCEIDAAYETLKQNGVKVEEIMKLPYGSMFRFYDMDGNVFLVRED